jgi:hypothetical protein
MTHIAIAETETEKTSREIEAEDSSGTLAQLKFVSEGGATIPAVGEARFEIKHLRFEIVVAMIVAAMVVAISALLPLA